MLQSPYRNGPQAHRDLEPGITVVVVPKIAVPRAKVADIPQFKQLP